MTALREEQLTERHPAPREEHQAPGGHGRINGIAQGRLGELLLPPGEQFPGTLDVFKGIQNEVSLSRMDESRLIELELRYMQQQELLLQLNDVLYTQQRALDVLTAEVELLKRKLEGEPGLVDARQHEKPPHY
jgi:SlyX protein